MSNALLAGFGTAVTMIAFGAFSIIQLGKAEARAGRQDTPSPAPHGDELPDVMVDEAA